MINKKKQGRVNRRKGREFEKRVQREIEKEGFIVCRWSKNFDENNKLVDAKSNRFNMRTCGFPDFLVIRPNFCYLVECKINGYLSPEERKKAQLCLALSFCKYFLVAHEVDGEIIFKEVQKERDDKNEIFNAS